MSALTDYSPIVVGVVISVWVLRELVPLVLRLQERRADSRRPPPPPPPPRLLDADDAAETSGEWQALKPGELTRRLIKAERRLESMSEMRQELHAMAIDVATIRTKLEMLLTRGSG